MRQRWRETNWAKRSTRMGLTGMHNPFQFGIGRAIEDLRTSVRKYVFTLEQMLEAFRDIDACSRLH